MIHGNFKSLLCPPRLAVLRHIQKIALHLLMVALLSSGVAQAADSNQPPTTAGTPTSESSLQSDSTTLAVPTTTLPHNLSPWGMFIAADWVVKTVMIGLAIASLLTWTVLLAKTIELSALTRGLKRNLVTLNSTSTLADAANISTITGAGRQLIKAAEVELNLSGKLSNQVGGKDGIKERVVSSLSRIEVAAARSMLTGTGLLATIGSVAPFIGLFGTVWGIMNSFIGISQANTTNLAVVAPGIAEALLATAMGLIAAIPAVIIYNHFTRKIAGAKTLVSDSAALVIRLVSRDLDNVSSSHAIHQKTAA